jgi:hypothetical protein
MTDHDDTLAGIDLHTWRIPPPLPFDRASLLVRALAPAAMPARRRMGWLLAAIVLVNAAIAALVVIFLARAPATQVVVEPAGGGVDARVGDLLQRLDQERRELERKLAEIEELRALVVELQDKIRRYEQRERDRTVPKKVDPLHPLPDHRPVDPYEAAGAPENSSCDEVSCVLANYEGTCCLKFKRPHPPAKVSSSGLPDALDRASISSGVASVKAKVLACGDRSTAKGMVKVRVRVNGDGHVASVIVETTPDPALGHCVAHELQQATFERTQQGAVFGYPFVF